MIHIRKLKEVYNPVSLVISGIVGTGIHFYSLFLVDDEHLHNIVEDFTNGNFLNGLSTSIAPYALPYVVSFVAGKISSYKVRREFESKIRELERKVQEMEK